MAKRLQDVIKSTPAKENKEIEYSPNGENSKESKLPKDELFELPTFNLNLGFLINKGNEPFTVESLLNSAFGDTHLRLSEPEKIFVLLNAMKDLEIIAPLQFECEHCGKANPIAVELYKVMKSSGTPKSHFFIEHKGYIFEFKRPQEIKEIATYSPTATIAMFMLQWLEAHNQGEDFDILNMPLADFLEIAKIFGDKMFGVEFSTKFKCAKCKKENNQDFAVTIQDVVAILNEL